MAGKLRIEKNTTVIELPEAGRLYEPGWIDFEVTERTINRALVSDFIAFKRLFVVSYDRVYGDLFADLLELFLAKEDVTFFEEQPNGTYQQYICRIDFPQSVKRELSRGLYGYTGFSFSLEEV